MAELTIYETAASGEDGYIARSGGSYPPTGSINVYLDANSLYMSKSKSGANYGIQVALLRFDTSQLAGKTITDAALNLYCATSVNADSRNLLVDYYLASNWPIDSADYAEDLTGNAAIKPLSDYISGWDWRAVVLGSIENINVDGYTGFRLGISGGQPVGQNVFGLDGRTSMYPPSLVVTYLPGYQHKALGCLPTTIASIMGIPTANIAKFNGV
jgi:hypothetical protein